MRTLTLLTALAVSAPAAAQQVEVEEYTLDNGMTFLLVPRDAQPNVVSAGWMARVGSVNERPGITGISHFFEHMMFKGTNTVGTSDAEKDAWFRAEQRRVRSELRALQVGANYDRWKRGEIDDPWDATHDTEEMAALRAELTQLIKDHESVIVNNEFDALYSAQGASGMNAFTSYDLTFYFITVPSNKMELWAWMESDRLADSTFREFYAERDVVHEERRLRTESTPTGIYDEQFNAMFYGSSPYSWPVVGWPTDLESYTYEQAEDYFATYYRPNNLVGVVVGDFDPEALKPTIDKYFSRLEAGEPPPPVVTLEMKQTAEKRMTAECDCAPGVEIRYHAVPFGHADSYALDVLASVLSSRTGRLYRGLVEGREIAANAYAYSMGMRLAGSFVFAAEAKGEAQPDDLERAWDAEIEKLKTEPITEAELQRVKNNVLASSYRQLRSNQGLMTGLGYYEALGGWEAINEDPKRTLAVTAEDVMRVANTYFDVENRAVAQYFRSADATPDDPELTALLADMPPQLQNMIKGTLKQLVAFDDAEQLAEAIAGVEKQAGQVPPGMKPALTYVLDKARKRLAELKK